MGLHWILAFLVFYPFLGAFLSWFAGTGRWKLLFLSKREGVSAAAGGRAVGGHFAGGKKTGDYSRKGLSADDCRDYLADLIVISEFLMMAGLFVRFAQEAQAGAVLFLTIPGICGFGLHFTLDGFRLIYGTVASLMWMMTTILSREYFAHHENRTRFYVFLLLTFGATMGVFLSADLYTTFIFFEIMSFTSYVWVAQEENAPSLRAASTYLAVAVIGGLVMLMGLFLVYRELGTLSMEELLAASRTYLENGGNRVLLYAAGVCLLFGFGAKAGAFPLHIWLPKAHPVAPAPASALLSGILTKTGIFGVLVTTSGLFLHDAPWGRLILAIGVVTMFLGALLAVFSVDLKRTLACSSMSQIGFILVGVGMQCLLGEENALAVHGTLLHMINHSLIKLVLFMAAGVIFMNTHALNLNEIRGYGRKKPLLKLIFLVGALSIGGIPLFCGYVSKTLLHESIVEYGGGLIFRLVEYIFLFSGGLTVAYMTKLFVAVFVEKNASADTQRKFDRQTHYMNGQSAFALAGSALLLVIWGCFPHELMDRAANLGQGLMHLEESGHVVSYFSLKNLSGGLISITIGALVYLIFIRRVLLRRNAKGVSEYVNLWPSWLDLEILYRKILLEILPLVFGTVCRALDEILEFLLHPLLVALGVICSAFDQVVDFLVKILIPLGTVIARIPDTLTDFFVLGLRKTVYRDSPLPHERTEGTIVTAAIGHILNFFQGAANRLWRRRNPTHRDYVHILAVRRAELHENTTLIGRSLSFGLLMFCIGLCLTLIYIIWL